MNTLLGEIATLNDIQYPVYRAAFKFRKLQNSFLLDGIDATTLQEAFHQTSIQSLGRSHVVPLTQLRSFITELYSSLKVRIPSLGVARLQQAQELLFNWLQMVYLTSTGGTIDAGSLKINLCLLSGAKPFDKSRYIFSILSDHNGTVDCTGLRYFCNVTQQIASSVQEELYTKWSSLTAIFHECLISVRSAEDIEDEEELEGGVKRPWLSQFEFTKIFTSLTVPKFLGWLALFQKLPSLESVVHSVRCCVCTRKPIVSFRYQCTECPSFNLCQMCFLKGRTTDRHLESHQVLEVTTGSKGNKSWKHRLLGISSRHSTGRLWTEVKEPFVFSPRNSRTSLSPTDQLDSAVNSITDMLNHSQQTSQGKGINSTHLPAMIRISNDDTVSKSLPSKPISKLVNGISAKPTRNASGKGPSNRSSISTVSSGGSPDSACSGGANFNFDGTLSSTSSDQAWHRSSHGNRSSSPGSDLHISPTDRGNIFPRTAVGVEHRDTFRSRESVVNSEDLTMINRRLSMEVDQLLSELPPPSTCVPIKLANNVNKLTTEGQTLENQVTNLSDRRAKLYGELNGLVSKLQMMQAGGNSSYPSPMHSRCDSAPTDPYPRVSHRSSMHHLGSSQQLLDPLVEFTPEQLSAYTANGMVSPKDHRCLLPGDCNHMTIM